MHSVHCPKVWIKVKVLGKTARHRKTHSWSLLLIVANAQWQNPFCTNSLLRAQPTPHKTNTGPVKTVFVTDTDRLWKGSSEKTKKVVGRGGWWCVTRVIDTRDWHTLECTNVPWTSIWVSGSVTFSDFGDSYCIYLACELVVFEGWQELDLSKLCEFCIKSCSERRKMTAVNWVN